jgi:hypothetical protein
MKTLGRAALGAWLVVGLVVATTTARGDIIARDNFDYVAGEVNGMSGGSGAWAGAWTNFNKPANSEVVSPSTPMTYNAGGGAATLGGGAALQLTKSTGIQTPVTRAFSGIAAGESVYFRFLLRLDTDTWDDNDFFTGWMDYIPSTELGTHGGTPSAGLRAVNDATANDFFARVSSDSAGHAVPGVAFSSQTTYLIVGFFESTDADTNYERASIWINPTSGEALTPHATGSGESASANLLDWVGWRFGDNLESDDVLLVDDVAITTTFNEAIGIPEPGTAVYLLCAAALKAMMGRRRRGGA